MMKKLTPRAKEVILFVLKKINDEKE